MTRAKPKKLSEAQMLLALHLEELGFYVEVEPRISPERRWRADIGIPSVRVYCECDGGMWSGGHKRGAALEDDYDKQNAAQALGWRILRFTNRQVFDGRARAFIKQHFMRLPK